MDLYGWDTVYAIRIDALNAALKGANGLPRSFAVADGGITAAGTFGEWSVVAGGAGILLHIQTTIASGKVSGGADPAADLTGYQVVFEIDMSLLPAPVGGKQEVRLALKSAGKMGAAHSAGSVTPYSISPDTLGFEQKIFLANALAQYLVTQADSVTIAFARINLVSPDAGDSWLTPAAVRFAYYPSGAGNYLVIYAATSTRDVSGLSVNVDPALLVGKGPAYFATSGDLFLEHVIMPLLPKVYDGFDASYFRFDAGRHCIANAKDMTLRGVKSGAIWYYPIVRSLAITIAGSQIVSTVAGDCDMYMGMSMTFSVTSNSVTSYDAAANKFSAAPDQHPVQHHEAHIPWYDYLLGAIPDLVMAIVVPIVADGIANGLSAAVSGMQLSQAGPQAVQWPGLRGFTPNGGGLNGGFQLSGS